MSKKKFYAIKNTQQVVTTWAECEAIVKGMSGAEYKSFKTEAEAQAFLTDTPVETTPGEIEVVDYIASNGIKGTITVAEDINPFKLDITGPIYAVDGSFNGETQVYGAGVAYYNSNETVLETKRVSGARPEFASARNVAGEVVAFATAISMAVEKMQNSITIICDYEGDFRWTAPKSVVVNEKACWGNKKGTPIAEYHAKAIDYARQNGIKTINFVWVRGHKGVTSNEIVDRLAKYACGLI